MNFSDKDPDEVEYVGFNFAKRLASDETITAASFSVGIVSGADANAATMLSGDPLIEGSIVKQLVGNGVAGVHYRVSAEVTTSSGQTLVESASLVVKEIG